MSKGPQGFTDKEKEIFKEKLRNECEKSWSKQGYKKTGIAEITTKVGISTGAFYLLYNSKEDLFCETLEQLQKEMKKEINKIIKTESNKQGFFKAVQWQFKKYNEYPFLYDFASPDYISFLSKLPQERIDNLKFDSVKYFDEVIKSANLKLKVSKKKANALISSVLYMVTIKEKLEYDSLEIFNFLLESIIDKIFE